MRWLGCVYINVQWLLDNWNKLMLMSHYFYSSYRQLSLKNGNTYFLCIKAQKCQSLGYVALLYKWHKKSCVMGRSISGIWKCDNNQAMNWGDCAFLDVSSLNNYEWVQCISQKCKSDKLFNEDTVMYIFVVYCFLY